jgi:hypothetical protein
MTIHIKKDDPDVATVTQRGTEQAPACAANDNDWEGSSPLVPLPEGRLGVPSGLQESNRLSTESACRSPASFRSSWRATLGKLAYVVAVSIAMFGWLYLLWLALVSGVLS